MEDNWVNIYETDQLYQAEIIKGLLCDNGVEALIFNQQDSSYILFGTIKVMINEKDAAKAAKIIKSVNCE